jgi:POT family proton-dependent oligopeptide transporter
MSSNVQVPPAAQWDRAFFGHPRGLNTLFFTEMWERFSYYGNRAILILYMVAATSTGGLGFSTAKAGAVYGLYASMAYLSNLPGGWVADRITGHRRAVLLGGILIALGQFCLATPLTSLFYVGLGLIIVGTGLLKPNISTMVGELYQKDDPRRDGGFSIFYMGINIGALISPLVCGYLGENVNWHYGFLAAGICMSLGVVQYLARGQFLGTAGLRYSGTPGDKRLFQRSLMMVAVLAVVEAMLVMTGVVNISAAELSDSFGLILAAVTIAFFTWLFTAKGYTPAERRNFWVVLILFIGSTMFWAAYEQAGSTLNLFAERNTNLHAWDMTVVGLFRASYLQSFNSAFLVVLAPVFAWIWTSLGKKDPNSTTKFSLGLFLVAAGYAILIPVAGGTAVSPWFLTLTYLLHTIGELCLSPVGLSAMTKLAPARIGGLIMGVWFLSISVGNYIAGEVASVYEKFPLPQIFSYVALCATVLGLVMVVLIIPTRKLLGEK